jgi:hypothetical protein
MDESKLDYAEGKKTVSKGYVLYNSISMTFWKSQNSRASFHVQHSHSSWSKEAL